jgi:hypothetical protein
MAFNHKTFRRNRIKQRVRNTISGTPETPENVGFKMRLIVTFMYSYR